MKNILLNKAGAGVILILSFSNSYSQTIERKTYTTGTRVRTRYGTSKPPSRIKDGASK